MDETKVEPPDWFWALLDRARPSLIALARRLEALPRDQLIEYAHAYLDAAMEVCPYELGPCVDGVQFSEDDTEDLCKWVVSMGREFWHNAVASGGALEPVVRLYWTDGRSDTPAWSEEVDKHSYFGFQSPFDIALAIFEERYGEDLLDYVDG